MCWKNLLVRISLVVLMFSGGFASADCPSADLTGDCFVDFEDFAVIAAQWLNGYDWNDVKPLADQWLTGHPNIPDDMVYIPDGVFAMGDHHDNGWPDELPLHGVLLDWFFMSKFEITNEQYCDYLNSAYDACDIKVDGGIVYAYSDDSNSYPYCDTHSYDTHSQVDYNDVSGTFSVRTKGEPPRDMSNDPMVEVSWYGAVGYCNWRSSEEGYESCYNPSTWDCNFSEHGYRLATEAEWEYAARGGEHSPYYRFPWGDTISHSQANYYSNWVGGSPYYPYDVNPTEGFHPAWNDGIWPYTSVVGSFPSNGYGLYDMAGNVFEWCNDWFCWDYYQESPYDNPTGPAKCENYRVIRGGNWGEMAERCRVGGRWSRNPYSRVDRYGFRIVLDLE